MAPDLEKKREPRRAAGAVAHFPATEETGGMQLALRCPANFFGNYYRHGNCRFSHSGGPGSDEFLGAVNKSVERYRRRLKIIGALA